MELLQYYVYICLDVFKGEKPRVGKKIDTWLEFLTIQDTDEMTKFLEKNGAFQSVYQRVILMSKDRKELLNMISDMLENEDIVGSINRTNESIIKRLRRELDEKKKKLKEKDKALRKQAEAHYAELQEKDALINELKRQLADRKTD